MRHFFFILIAFLLLVASSCAKKATDEFQPTQRTITESVYASGVIKAENQYTVYTTVSGVLQKSLVVVGQAISQGQPLFQIESDKATLNTENARLAYQLSQENSRYIQDKIADMETKVQMAKDKLTLDLSVYSRNKNAKQYGGISEIEYEKIELTYKNSKSNYESTVKQLSQLKAQLKNEQSRNNITLKINEKSQSDFTIKSAFSGELFDILVKYGTFITTQTPLAIIGKKNAYLLELDVDENDMARVALGQKIVVTLDSYKGKAFDAIVDKIYPIMDERSRTFKIEAHFVTTPAKLYPNLTAEANIVIQTKKNVVTIPKSYLVENTYVLVNKDEKRKVTIGLMDYQYAEILNGLKAGETILQTEIMNFKLILNIAVHLLRARLKQSIVAAVGVTFGIAMFITLVSFMHGLNNMLDELMLNRTPHVRLYNEIKPSEHQPISLSETYKNDINFVSSVKPKDRGKAIYNSKAIIHYLKQDSRIIDVAPKITAPVFFNSGTIEISGVVYGIDVMAEEKLFKLSDYIIEGKVSDLSQNNSIIIGKGLADKMLLKKGDVIKITTAKGSLASMKVVGITQIGIADLDNTMSYTSLDTAQKLLSEPTNYITDIQIKLHDINTAPALANEFRAKFDVDAIDYQTSNSQFETGSTVRSIISYAVGIVLLIVAGFGIYNILNMMIFEKMDSIAILKATGFSGNDVKWIFIVLSMVIGITGGLFGLLFGFIFTSIIDVIPFSTAALPTIKTYPIDYNIVYYFIGISFALCTTFIAGLFPALKAGKVDPVEIIRGK